MTKKETKVMQIDTSMLIDAANKYNLEVEKIFKDIKNSIEVAAKKALEDIDDVLKCCSDNQKVAIVGGEDIPIIDINNFRDFLVKIVNNGISREIFPTISGSLSDHILLEYYGLDYKLSKLHDCITMIERINIDCIKNFH